MRKIFTLLYACSLTVILSCDNEKDKIYPQVQTLDIAPVAASSFLVKGNVVVLGDTRVQQYGFVYAVTPNVDIFQGTIAAVDDVVATTGQFQKTITLNLDNPAGYSLYVRAFLTNERGTVYGEVKQFDVPLLGVENVSPLVGRTGDVITIKGKNFSTTPDDNTVTFNNIDADVVEATSTQLKVKVPPGILFPAYKEYNTIEVTTAEQTILATDFFKVIPTVASFSPANGSFGTMVTITGSDFYPLATSVRVGGEEALATVNLNTVTFNIPLTVTDPTPTIQLVSGTTLVDVMDVPGTFTMNQPTITNITPLTGIGGADVVITGTNFNVGEFNYSYNVVKFGTLEADAFNSGPNQITAKVPFGLNVGNYKISVFTGVYTVTSAGNFTVATPKVTGFSPAAGPPFSFILINGTNFGAFNEKISAVLLGSTAAEIFSWNDTLIRVRIPASMPAGAVLITVNAGAQSATSTTTFTVQ